MTRASPSVVKLQLKNELKSTSIKTDFLRNIVSVSNNQYNTDNRYSSDCDYKLTSYQKISVHIGTIKHTKLIKFDFFDA